MITNDIKYIGVNDHEIDLFEGQYSVPCGMAYNSYIIIDEKIAVMDSVDIRFADLWIENIKTASCGRLPDYLVIHHMEPDHSSSIMKFVLAFPDARLVASGKAFNMMQGFFGNDFSDRRIIVGEGDELDLGRHKLTFIAAPMVHWPEVIMSYDSLDKALFSADGFGKFGALDCSDDWVSEARRYYFCIVGKYGAQVQALLKKLGGLDVRFICPLHGPVLKENLDYYIGLYDTWSRFLPESEGVCIAYTSVYGNTRAAVDLLVCELQSRGVRLVAHDLARCDVHRAVEDAFTYDKLVLATTTYNGDIFPFMKEFIDHLTERNYQNRAVAFVENGSWAPIATKIMKNMLTKSKDLTFVETEVSIKSALNDKSREQIKALAEKLAK